MRKHMIKACSILFPQSNNQRTQFRVATQNNNIYGGLYYLSCYWFTYYFFNVCQDLFEKTSWSLIASFVRKPDHKHEKLWVKPEMYLIYFSWYQFHLAVSKAWKGCHPQLKKFLFCFFLHSKENSANPFRQNKNTADVRKHCLTFVKGQNCHFSLCDFSKGSTPSVI